MSFSSCCFTQLAGSVLAAANAPWAPLFRCSKCLRFFGRSTPNAVSWNYYLFDFFFSSNCPIRTEQWNSADTPRYDFTKRIHYKLNKKPELSAKLLPCGGLLKGTTLSFCVCVCPPFKRRCGADRGFTELHLMSCMSIPEPPPTILYLGCDTWSSTFAYPSEINHSVLLIIHTRQAELVNSEEAMRLTKDWSSPCGSHRHFSNFVCNYWRNKIRFVTSKY